MVVEQLNTTITGSIISANLLLRDVLSKAMLVFLAFVLAALMVYVVWNRYRGY